MDVFKRLAKNLAVWFWSLFRRKPVDDDKRPFYEKTKGEVSRNSLRNHARRLIMATDRKKVCQCKGCECHIHVECAHLIPVSYWPDDTKVLVINRLDNIAYLCPCCHWKLDHGHLNLLDLEGIYD